VRTPAKLLTDLGAEVVHWEPSAGDAVRREDPHGALYAYLRTSQRCVSGDDAAPWIAGATWSSCPIPSPMASILRS